MIFQMGISGDAEGRLDGKGTEQRKESGKEAGSNSLICPLKKSLNLHTGDPRIGAVANKTTTRSRFSHCCGLGHVSRTL